MAREPIRQLKHARGMRRLWSALAAAKVGDERQAVKIGAHALLDHFDEFLTPRRRKQLMRVAKVLDGD